MPIPITNQQSSPSKSTKKMQSLKNVSQSHSKKANITSDEANEKIISHEPSQTRYQLPGRQEEKSDSEMIYEVNRYTKERNSEKIVKKKLPLCYSVSSDEGESSSEDNEGDLSINDPRSTLDDQNSKSSKKKASNAPFPQQLFCILSKEAYADIISWLPHGKAFIVHDKKRFVEVVSPNYFKETRFESFTRKLNRWCFVRISKGPETGAFQHELFSRDDALKCSKIRCQKKYERKTPRSGISKKKNIMSPKEATNEAISLPNKDKQASIKSASPTPSSGSLDVIMKAQMEQMQRSYLLNYISLKQQYDQRLKSEMCLKAQLSSHHEHKIQVLNYLSKKQRKSIPNIPRFQEISNTYQKQCQQQMPPLTLGTVENVLVPVLPTMLSLPSPSEQNEKITQKQLNVKTKQQNQEDSSREGIVSKTAGDFKSNTTSNSPQAEFEENKLSACHAAETYLMPLSLKECYNDTIQCNLPLKKKIKKRHLEDNQSNDSISSSNSSSSKDGIVKRRLVERASAA